MHIGGKADLAAGANEALADVVKGVAEGKMAVVSGFHDATGDAALNAELAKQRALAVRDALKPGEDGSVTLYVQRESPGPDKEANWLPAPEGSYQLILRLYWPKEAALDGEWKTPQAIKQ